MRSRNYRETLHGRFALRRLLIPPKYPRHIGTPQKFFTATARTRYTKTIDRPQAKECTSKRRHPCQHLSANGFADQGGSLPPLDPRLASLRSRVVMIPKNPRTRALTKRRLWVTPFSLRLPPSSFPQTYRSIQLCQPAPLSDYVLSKEPKTILTGGGTSPFLTTTQ